MSAIWIACVAATTGARVLPYALFFAKPKTVILAHAAIQFRRSATEWGPRVREDDVKNCGVRRC